MEREGRGKLNLKHLFCDIVVQGEELRKSSVKQS